MVAKSLKTIPMLMRLNENLSKKWIVLFIWILGVPIPKYLGNKLLWRHTILIMFSSNFYNKTMKSCLKMEGEQRHKCRPLTCWSRARTCITRKKNWSMELKQSVESKKEAAQYYLPKITFKEIMQYVRYKFISNNISTHCNDNSAFGVNETFLI